MGRSDGFRKTIPLESSDPVRNGTISESARFDSRSDTIRHRVQHGTTFDVRRYFERFAGR
ncbi:hypothetical protein A4G99_14115 [Haladaptatus sp. R4]|nr:hypothetical protein A4G99_14115 [Haladaptatus sp. R4]